jgi:hypothetical protein
MLADAVDGDGAAAGGGEGAAVVVAEAVASGWSVSTGGAASPVGTNMVGVAIADVAVSLEGTVCPVVLCPPVSAGVSGGLIDPVVGLAVRLDRGSPHAALPMKIMASSQRAPPTPSQATAAPATAPSRARPNRRRPSRAGADVSSSAMIWVRPEPT